MNYDKDIQSMLRYTKEVTASKELAILALKRGRYLIRDRNFGF